MSRASWQLDRRGSCRKRVAVSAFIAVLGVAVAVPMLAAAGEVGAKPSGRDRAILKAATIRQSDVPRDWEPTRGRNDILSSIRGSGTCMLVDTAAPHATPRPFDGVTLSGASARVEDAVFVFKDTTLAGGPLGVFHAGTAPMCLQATQQDLFAQSGSGLEVVGTSPLAGVEDVGDDHAGYEMVATDQPQTMTFYADVLAVRVRRAVLIFRFDSFDQPFAQRLDVVRAITARLARAAKG